MEENTEEVFLDDASKYFTAEEWNSLSRRKKIRYEYSYDIYVRLIKIGRTNIDGKPDFMKPKHEQQTKLDSKRKKRKTGDQKKIKKWLKRRGDFPPQRYPRRNIPVVNYEEEEELIVPNDCLVYCDMCMNEYVDECEDHPIFLLPDESIPLSPRNPDRARLTVPKGLQISRSKIRNAGEGVWTLHYLKIGIRFGPYEGVVDGQEINGNYSWQIRKENGSHSHIDGYDTSKSNWMRYVNCARNKREQNLWAFQYKNQIYYRTVRNISPGTELLVFYGPQFGKILGIDLKKFNSTLEEPLQDNTFECKKCKLVFSNPIYLENHKTRCKNEKENIANDNNVDEYFKCHLCSMMYTLKSLYQRHLVVKHSIYSINASAWKNTDSDSVNTLEEAEDNSDIQSGDVRRKHKCVTCQKAFLCKSNLINHTRTHTQERPFSCDVCKKQFSQEGSLKAHKRIHNGEKPYVCDVCNKQFSRADYLITHKRFHNGEKPYVCDVCNKQFSVSCHLKTHKRIHNGEKPYVCDVCNKQFSQLCNLKTHKRIHNEEKPYVCDVCEKKFKHSVSLKTHKRIHF